MTWPEQLQDRKRRDRLAGTAFAYQRYLFARLDAERDTVYRRDGPEANAEIIDSKQAGIRGVGRCPSALERGASRGWLANPRIQSIPEPIAHQVEQGDHHKDECPWDQRDMGRRGQYVPALTQHAAQVGGGWLGAQAQER